MAEFHFIKDQNALGIIGAILDFAGSNFNPPFDAYAQPIDGLAKNSEELIQFQLPGASSLSGYADPSIIEGMGSAISSMVGTLAPWISAYALVLPIIGVIRGIIEILCCLMNPFCAIKAIIRFFKKWLPPFIALFPPLAAIILIISVLKTMIAIILQILTTVTVVIELIKENIRILQDAFGPDGNEAQKRAAAEKLLSMLVDLLNQIGIIGVFKPVLEIIFLIMGLVAGFPCSKGQSRGDCAPENLVGVAGNYECSEDDAACCGDDTCPPALKNPPAGRALLTPTYYADSPPLYAWSAVTLSGNSLLSEIERYNQSISAQLNSQLDEPISESKYAGQADDSAHFKIKFTSRRTSASITTPILSINLDNNTIYVLESDINGTVTGSSGGVVNYEIIPNWEMLIKNNIIGLACHPDVEAAKQSLQSRFPDLNVSAIEKYPEITNIKAIYDGTVSDLNGLLGRLDSSVKEITRSAPPYDIDNITDIQADISNLLISSVGDLKDEANSLLSKVVDTYNSDFEVDKTIVPVGNDNYAKIIITPRDAAGIPLLKNIPNGVGITANIFTNIGDIFDQKIVPSSGAIEAKIKSIAPGVAAIKVKLNDKFIQNILNDGTFEDKSIQVQFVSDDILPKRRVISKRRDGARNNSYNLDSTPGKK